MARRIESHNIAGPAGRLEALLEVPDDVEPREVCLLCHPHPLGGGTMHNKVVHRMARAIRQSGATVLRFNFRGVGLSEGAHAHGVGELEDARAALEWLRQRNPGMPYALAGFSFGSRIILKLGCEVGGARLLLAAGMPTRRQTLPFLNICTTPKVFISSTLDEYAPKQEVEQWVDEFAEPKQLSFIEAKDHFFDGALNEFEAAVGAAFSKSS